MAQLPLKISEKSKSSKTLTNLILSCHHILYGVSFDQLNHRVGKQVWCPTCGLVGITEVESPWAEQEEEE
jgi:hypothetical protein